MVGFVGKNIGIQLSGKIIGAHKQILTMKLELSQYDGQFFHGARKSRLVKTDCSLLRFDYSHLETFAK